jgi:hypothetical protein
MGPDLGLATENLDVKIFYFGAPFLSLVALYLYYFTLYYYLMYYFGCNLFNVFFT